VSSANTPHSFRHYIIVDRSDLHLFRKFENSRTAIATVEDVIPRAFFKTSWLGKRWLSAVSLPLKGWHIQQIVKISASKLY
jgi:hypothetical protein